MRRKEREVTEMGEIISIIDSADVCRVAFADNGIPYIVTMNFGFQDGEIPELYFHCAHEGRKLDMLNKNNYVCFEMDTDHEINRGEIACDWGMKFRSVVGYGRIFKVDNEKERKKGLDLIMEHYGAMGPLEYDPKTFDRTAVLKLEVHEIKAKIKN